MLTLLKLYAPYAPHITEEIYQLYFRQFEKAESLHLTEIPGAEKLLAAEEEAQKTGELLVKYISEVRTYKSKNQIAFKAAADSLSISSTKEGIQHLQKVERILRNFSSSKAVSWKEIPNLEGSDPLVELKISAIQPAESP